MLRSGEKNLSYKRKSTVFFLKKKKKEEKVLKYFRPFENFFEPSGRLASYPNL